MSRPKPKVLLEYVNKKTYKSEQILEADAIWAVFYKGEPFNLKSASNVTSYPGPLELRSYEIPFTEPIDLSPQTIIFFDRTMDFPYYLTNQSITVFSERKSFELYMFSDDIRKYGLVKAMNNQNKDSQTDINS